MYAHAFDRISAYISVLYQAEQDLSSICSGGAYRAIVVFGE